MERQEEEPRPRRREELAEELPAEGPPRRRRVESAAQVARDPVERQEEVVPLGPRRRRLEEPVAQEAQGPVEEEPAEEAQGPVEEEPAEEAQGPVEPRRARRWEPGGEEALEGEHRRAGPVGPEPRDRRVEDPGRSVERREVPAAVRVGLAVQELAEVEEAW